MRTTSEPELVTYLRHVARHKPVRFGHLLMLIMNDDARVGLMKLIKTLGVPDRIQPTKPALLLKRAILLAAQKEGMIETGQGAEVAYLTIWARQRPRQFFGLLLNLLPGEFAAHPLPPQPGPINTFRQPGPRRRRRPHLAS